MIKGKPFHSINIPWIYAIPDFLAIIKERDNEFLASVKLVVTNDSQVFSDSLNIYETELQITLDCVGVNTGYLISILYSEKNYKKGFELKIDKVNRNFKLVTDHKTIIRLYTFFLNDVIYDLTGNSISVEFIKSNLERLVDTDRVLEISNINHMLNRPSKIDSENCEYIMLTKRIDIKKRGRPRKRIIKAIQPTSNFKQFIIKGQL